MQCLSLVQSNHAEALAPLMESSADSPQVSPDPGVFERDGSALGEQTAEDWAGSSPLGGNESTFAMLNYASACVLTTLFSAAPLLLVLSVHVTYFACLIMPVSLDFLLRSVSHPPRHGHKASERPLQRVARDNRCHGYWHLTFCGIPDSWDLPSTENSDVRRHTPCRQGVFGPLQGKYA